MARPVAAALSTIAVLVAGGAAALPASGAGAAGPGLEIFDGFSASESVYMQPRSNAVFALPAEQLIGATHAEINSQPRAQGYAATYGVPLAQNFRGVGVPVDYYGQCYANYPGDAVVECGVPFMPGPGVQGGEPGQGGGGAFNAKAEASGDSTDPAKTLARGVTEGGGMFLGGAVSIGYSRSESKSFLADGTLHAVTRSVAQDVTVNGVLHIGSVKAAADAAHSGDVEEATGDASTVMQDVTIGGVPVTIGPKGLMVQGQPIGEAPDDVSGPILKSMAEGGLTIEPLPAPGVTRDANTGLLQATTAGFRVQALSPNGDGKFELIFGRALARAGAHRGETEGPVEIPIDADGSETQAAWAPRRGLS
jgi:hypothetical protein